MIETVEEMRLHDGQDKPLAPWRKWGAYVSDRAWGTVREDYSASGDAWNFLTHDMARSKAYRWGEDALAGWCDRYQILLFSLALWNGKDPILKERLFGLNPNEGNHGEDVKEVYCHLDALPTHSYMKFFYRYPQEAFPYEQLLKENQKRTVNDREFELVDTGVFQENRFFDCIIEYAKASPEDTCIRIEIINQGPHTAPLFVLPQLWFRNRWSWKKDQYIPEISVGPSSKEFQSLYADPKNMSSPDWRISEYPFPPYYLTGLPASGLLFTNNESNNSRLYKTKNHTPYVKDAFHRYLIHKEACINPERKGTKACFLYSLNMEPRSSEVLYFRLSPTPSSLSEVEKIVQQRRREADAFYAGTQTKKIGADQDRAIQRQALAGLMWSTQYYWFHVKRWLEGDDLKAPPPDSRYTGRNTHWEQLRAHDLFIMPDKWEYPWFASWDSVFQAVALSLVDLPFAKQQMRLFLEHSYQHPNGQIPAYEWGFSEMNPPVQAWGVWYLYQKEKRESRKGDLPFLHDCFIKLLHNYGWWLNKVDRQGNNLFEGGFLGMDNISFIDRSKVLSNGGFFEQSDGTGWMGFFSLSLFRMALELSALSSDYEQVAILFFENYMMIANAIQGTRRRPMDLWDEEDGFFYDVLCLTDGSHHKLKIRSFVGLIPFVAFDSFEEEELKAYPRFYSYFTAFIKHHPHLLNRSIIECVVSGKKKILFSLMTIDQIKRVLTRVFDPEEFLAPYGLRSLSKYHAAHPYDFHNHHVAYEPAEALEKIKGGNSNWRGPIWFPTNFLFLESLKKLTQAIEGELTIPFQGKMVDLNVLVQTLRERLISLFRQDTTGARPIFADTALFSTDAAWKDLLLFFEHYHPETGRGLGASHQTGWSALVANLIDEN